MAFRPGEHRFLDTPGLGSLRLSGLTDLGATRRANSQFGYRDRHRDRCDRNRLFRERGGNVCRGSLEGYRLGSIDKQ
jgi:hypothetical protein